MHPYAWVIFQNSITQAVQSFQFSMNLPISALSLLLPLCHDKYLKFNTFVHMKLNNETAFHTIFIVIGHKTIFTSHDLILDLVGL